MTVIKAGLRLRFIWHVHAGLLGGDSKLVRGDDHKDAEYSARLEGASTAQELCGTACAVCSLTSPNLKIDGAYLASGGSRNRL